MASSIAVTDRMPNIQYVVDYFQIFTSFVTPLAIGGAIWQIAVAKNQAQGTQQQVRLMQEQVRLTQEQAQTSFEDALAKEYREVVSRIPAKALLSESLSADEQSGSLDEFYQYFDLSNEQVFLRQKERVSDQTWVFWRDGIQSNYKRPAFRQAWDHINKYAPKDFSELQRLFKNFQQDPAEWKE